jgi:hypothetical protein
VPLALLEQTAGLGCTEQLTLMMHGVLMVTSITTMPLATHGLSRLVLGIQLVT